MYVETSYLRGCYCMFCIKANVSRQLVARRKGRSIASSLYFRREKYTRTLEMEDKRRERSLKGTAIGLNCIVRRFCFPLKVFL